MLDFRKPLQTRHGYPARLVYDALTTHPYGPLVFAITHDDGVERLGFRRADGSYPIENSDNRWDIVHAVKREVVIELWEGVIDIKALPSDVHLTVIEFDVDRHQRAVFKYGPGDKP